MMNRIVKPKALYFPTPIARREQQILGVHRLPPRNGGGSSNIECRFDGGPPDHSYPPDCGIDGGHRSAGLLPPQLDRLGGQIPGLTTAALLAGSRAYSAAIACAVAVRGAAARRLPLASSIQRRETPVKNRPRASHASPTLCAPAWSRKVGTPMRAANLSIGQLTCLLPAKPATLDTRRSSTNLSMPLRVGSGRRLGRPRPCRYLAPSSVSSSCACDPTPTARGSCHTSWCQLSAVPLTHRRHSGQVIHMTFETAGEPRGRGPIVT